MIRRIIDWFLYKFHVKKKRELGIKSLMELMPILCAAMIVIEMFGRFGGGVKLSWYKLVWSKTKYLVWRLRAAVVGY